MAINREIIDKLKDLTDPPVQVFAGQVESVDEDAQTCEVKPVNGPKLYDVRIKAAIDEKEAGLIVVPVIGSTVLLGLIGNDTETAFIVKYTSIERLLITTQSGFKLDLSDEGIIMNQGKHDGLPILGAVVNKLNRLEQKHNTLVQNFNALIMAYNAHVHSGVTTGPGSSGPTPAQESPSTAQVTPQTQKSDLENKDVKQ